MPQERILITVRTYPTPSSQYLETVCTGGITEGGEWRRLYPIPLRYLDGNQKFHTYDIIRSDVTIPRSDRRPESRSPDNRTIEVQGHLDEWDSKANWVRSAGFFETITAMEEQGRSMGMIYPANVDDILIEEDSAEWTAEQLEKLNQQQLFISENKPLEKVPRKFWLVWKDVQGKSNKSRILSWEIHQTWRNWRTRYLNVDERVREKFMNDICGDTIDLGLYIGNYAMHPQHFAILGFYHPPKGTIHDTLW